MVNSVTLINATESINAKIAVYNIPYTWNSQTQDFDIPKNYTTISPVQYNGLKNPTFTLKFALYWVDNPSGFITWEQWMKLCRSTTPTTMNIVLSSSDIDFKSYATTSSGTKDIKIQIINFTTVLDPNDSVNSDIIDITATVMETI